VGALKLASDFLTLSHMRIQMNTEKLLQHIRTLEEEHLILDSHIKDGYSKFINDTDLNKMKFEKLELKREIETLKQQYNKIRIK